ncbi:MAG: hypothetical protein US53_C0042G0005, partial [Candidatus Woesebacteria bacterium GW2011_GWA1_37_7]
MKRVIVFIIVLGVLLRLILALGSFHPDIKAFYYAGEVISKGNFLNFYDYLGKLPVSDPIHKIYPANLFIYPPLMYFFIGPVTHLLTLPFPGGFLQSFVFDLPGILGNLQLNLLLLALKAPYILFDAAIGWLLYSFFKKPKNKILALSFWVFNPVNLYATYMMGQFDIIPTFFTVLALYFAVKKEKYFLAALFLGFGASFKIFPIIFLIPLALLRDKWLDRIKIIGIGAVTYIATILPFINSQGYRGSALLAGQTTKSFYAAIPISGGESIIIFPLLMVFFCFLFFYLKGSLESLWSRFFIMLLLFFIFTHYHPQWFVWITPFLIIDLIKSGLKHWPLTLLSLISWLGLITFFDPGLTTRIFAPLVPSLQNAPGLWESLGISFDLNWSRSILQTVFAAAGLYYIYYYFP